MSQSIVEPLEHQPHPKEQRYTCNGSCYQVEKTNTHCFLEGGLPHRQAHVPSWKGICDIVFVTKGVFYAPLEALGPKEAFRPKVMFRVLHIS
jgi:hypothetical protein